MFTFYEWTITHMQKALPPNKIQNILQNKIFCQSNSLACLLIILRESLYFLYHRIGQIYRLVQVTLVWLAKLITWQKSQGHLQQEFYINLFCQASFAWKAQCCLDWNCTVVSFRLKKNLSNDIEISSGQLLAFKNGQNIVCLHICAIWTLLPLLLSTLLQTYTLQHLSISHKSIIFLLKGNLKLLPSSFETLSHL